MAVENESNPYSAGQSAPQDSNGKSHSSIAYFVVEAILLLGITVLTLDFGQLFRVAVISVLAHAILILLIAVRRPTSPTKLDIFIVKWGLILVFVVAFFVASLIGRLNL